MDADLVSQTLKICNLTTIEAILMKRSSIIYLCKTFHLANTWGGIQRASENTNINFFFLISIFFQTKLKNSDIHDAFTCIELLVNIL